jgi:hypothetical protein
MYFLFWYDYVLLPLYLLVGILIVNALFHRRHGHNPILKKHFNRGLVFKLVGCVFIAMIYEYYYNGAYDGRFYFEGAKMLTNYWLQHPGQIGTVLGNDMYHFNETNLAGLSTFNVNIYANESFFVCKIAGIFNFLCFDAFLPCSIIFCLIAFMALWNFFVFLIKEFQLPAQLAGFCTIYIPSVLIWDSSIFKDTVTFTALCWMFTCAYYSFIKPRNLVKNLSGFLICAFVIAQIKIYILAAFAPFLILYIFNAYKSKIRNPAVRVLATPFVLGISIALIALFLQNAGSLLGKYSADKVLETAAQTNYDISNAGQAGSAYSMNVDFSSPLGLLAAVPQGINVTLFRPYPWEFLKPIILFASAESMIILYFTLFIIFKIGFFKVFRAVWRSPILQFCLLFSFTFAFMVGVSSSNFGSLVRYKIPILPFYILFLALLYKRFYAVFKPKEARQMMMRKTVA